MELLDGSTLWTKMVTRYEDTNSFNVSEIHINIIIMVLNMKVNILFYIFTGWGDNSVKSLHNWNEIGSALQHQETRSSIHF